MLRKTITQPLIQRGFSLVELLTVMSIIAILLSLASVGIGKIGKGQGVTAGLSLGEGLLAQAKTLAINNNAPARLVIHNELNDQLADERQNYRRMMMVMYKEVDPTTGEENEEWTRFGRPTLLPDSVYYSPEFSLRDMRSGGQLMTDRHQLTSDPEDTRECVYYEFNGQGICSTPGAGFVLVEAPRPPNQERPIISRTKNAGGFAVLRNGSTAFIRDIDRVITSTN